MQVSEAFIVAAARTPVGKANRGALRSVRPEQLGATAVAGALARVPGLAGERVDDVVMGCAFPEGPQGMNVARAIARRAGLPNSVPAATVNRFCSSGLQSIAQATAGVMAGHLDVVVAGGVECMSLVPQGGFYFAPDPHLTGNDPGFYTSMGITAENVAERYAVSREDQDVFALRSHRRALDAIESGRFADEIVGVDVEEDVYDSEARAAMHVRRRHEVDEGPRADTTSEALAKLRPVFKAGGTVTAGNASQMNDGAAAVVVMSRAAMDELGATPRARLAGYAVAGVDPEVMGMGPVNAVPKLLAQTGMRIEDIELFELNEAFASQSLAVVRELGLDEELVNVNGGAIALGHPLGCTGAKLTATLLYEMERRRVRWGIVTMCIGGGMGAAGLFENLRT